MTAATTSDPEPPTTPPEFSEDQRAAAALAAAALREAGVDIEAGAIDDAPGGRRRVVAVLGKAGSGKTHLLAWLAERLRDAGAKPVSAEPDGARKKKAGASFAVVAPTNKAASVLRGRGVPATTIHRIIYSPVYDPEYEAIAEWLADPKAKPRPEDVEGVTAQMLDRALDFYGKTKSAPGALAMVGLRGSAFITGWKRRDEALDIGLVDEASMLDQAQLDDLKAIFHVVVLFGDPAQLAPVGPRDGSGGGMAFDKLPEADRRPLARVHRQAEGNPIIDLAYALQEDISFEAFEDKLRETAARDARVVVSPRVDPDVMARAPVMVWRNATRVRLIGAFRSVFELSEIALSPGEPLICDGLELRAQNRAKRIDLEQAGLVKGAQAFWLGEGKKPGFARLHVVGAPQPTLSAAAIIQLERPGEEEPIFPTAARQGAVFLHGAACTIHKSQGSQWPTAQVFATDLFAAARSGRVEDGAPLWRRLAYVAITRAEERLLWVTRYAMGKPKTPLGVEDLVEGPLL